MDEAVLAWLRDGDVAVQFRLERDIVGRVDTGMQERIALEGDGATILAARGPQGWGDGFYRPKWTCSHYTLLELKNMGLSRSHPGATDAVNRILDEEKGADGGLNPADSVRVSDACINGMALGYASYFGAPEDQLASVVDFLLGQWMADGGFNCRLNRSGARHSSVHTTVCVIEGVTEYARSGYHYRLAEMLDARAGSIDFLLRHRLYRSERTGEPIRAEFTRLHHPARWHYDVLRGLDAMAEAGVAHDARIDDALDVVRARRRKDGRWGAARPYPGETHLPATPAGAPSRWVTLTALRVLEAYRSAGAGDSLG